MNGRVEGIYLAAAASEPLAAVEVAVIGKAGLEGDRYAAGVGSFSRYPGAGRAVTLIEAEVIEEVLAATDLDLTDGRSRRNIVTRGVRLLSLMGRRFRLGTALLHGDRPADPCAVLERHIGPGLMEALKGRGGLRATVLEAGEVRLGDSIEARP